MTSRLQGGKSSKRAEGVGEEGWKKKKSSISYRRYHTYILTITPQARHVHQLQPGETQDEAPVADCSSVLSITLAIHKSACFLLLLCLWWMPPCAYQTVSVPLAGPWQQLIGPVTPSSYSSPESISLAPSLESFPAQSSFCQRSGLAVLREG